MSVSISLPTYGSVYMISEIAPHVISHTAASQSQIRHAPCCTPPPHTHTHLHILPYKTPAPHIINPPDPCTLYKTTLIFHYHPAKPLYLTYNSPAPQSQTTPIVHVAPLQDPCTSQITTAYHVMPYTIMEEYGECRHCSTTATAHLQSQQVIYHPIAHLQSQQVIYHPYNPCRSYTTPTAHLQSQQVIYHPYSSPTIPAGHIPTAHIPSLQLTYHPYSSHTTPTAHIPPYSSHTTPTAHIPPLQLTYHPYSSHTTPTAHIPPL